MSKSQSFGPSDMNFQMIWMPKVILTEILSQKTGQVEPFFSLSML